MEKSRGVQFREPICTRYYIYIHSSKENDCEGGDDRDDTGDDTGDDDEDNNSDQEEGTKEDDSNDEDYKLSIQSE